MQIIHDRSGSTPLKTLQNHQCRSHQQHRIFWSAVHPKVHENPKMGLSENVVYHFLPNGFADQTIPFWNGYFIGNINPTFSDKPIFSWTELPQDAPKDGPPRIDIMAPGTNKAAGLHVLQKSLGLSMAECCAIGDSENDLEMLQSVRVACAMGNAVKKTKAPLKWVTKFFYDVFTKS